MAELLAVGAGGFLGAVARYLLNVLAYRVAPGLFPAGTFAVNVLGCLAMGALMAFVHRGAMGGPARMLWIVGFLGSFTTFSTFGWETVALLRAREFGFASASVAANLVLGIAAVWLGWLAAR